MQHKRPAGNSPRSSGKLTDDRGNHSPEDNSSDATPNNIQSARLSSEWSIWALKRGKVYLEYTGLTELELPTSNEDGDLPTCKG
jgi:hypothetical protein